MSFLKIFKRFLSKYPTYYQAAARFYNFFRQLVMRFHCTCLGVKYFAPTPKKGLYKSQFGQDYVLESLGLLRHGGVFVEVGANDPVFNSNSYFLEKAYNYTGIAIDAIDFQDKYLVHRPKTEFVKSVIDNKGGEIDFYIVENEDGWENQLSSVRKDVVSSGRGYIAKAEKQKSCRLDELCKHFTAIDGLLIDVEGHEFEVLESFDFTKFKPLFVLVENNGEFYAREKLQRYMRQWGYLLEARIGTYDDVYVCK
jgi:hypothetical protein